MKRLLFGLALALFSLASFAQVGISESTITPDASSILELNTNSKGILIPRMTASQKLSISSPAQGLMIYQTDVDTGFWYYKGSQWVALLSDFDDDWVKTSSTVYNANDSVAIGRTTPYTDFHIASAKNVLYGDSLSGSGFKQIYYAQKGAFRVGYLNNPFGGYNYDRFWDYDSVGYYSFAAGQNSRAKGFGAFAFGSFGWADGSGSVAFFGNAKGNNSFTFGGSSKGRGSITFEGVADEEGGIAMYGYTGGRYGVSIGGGSTGLGASSSREDYAIAIGWNSDARGQASIALGPSDAYGYNSFSTGWVTEARGNYSSTFGYQTNSYPYASMALGRFNVVTGDSAAWVSTDPIFMVGDGTNNSSRSNSFTILKNGQTAVGYNTPTGMLNVSTALGSVSTPVDATNAAILIGTSSTGMAFDANQIETIGDELHLNYGSTQDIRMVEGGGDVGIGGVPTTKLDVIGTGWQFRLNNTGTGGGDFYVGSSQTSWASGGGRFLISSTSTSSNAEFVIDGADGQIGMGTMSPSDKLHINSGSGEPALRVQVNSTTRFRVHTNGGVSIGANVTPPAEGMYVDGESEFNGDILPDDNNTYSIGDGTFRWTTVYATNGVINTSDKRDKEQIKDLGYGLEEVLQFRPVSFTWKGGSQQNNKIGLLAQDLQQVVPEVVQDGERLGVYYSDLIPVLINAIQEQQAIIDDLEKRIEKLED